MSKIEPKKGIRSSFVYAKSKEVSISALIQLHDSANSNAGPLTTPLTCDINLIELSSIVRVICCNKDSDSSITLALLKILFNCNSVLQ